MALTKRQSELMKDIEAALAFLKKEFPDSHKYKIAEVMEHAGHGPVSFYQMLKSLIRQDNVIELNKIRQLFAACNMKVVPLENWFVEHSAIDVSANSNQPLKFEEEFKPEPIKVEQSVVAEPKRLLVVDEHDDIEMSSTTFHPQYVQASVFQREIESLSAVLRILAPLPRDKRASILASAESFFGMGH